MWPFSAEIWSYTNPHEPRATTATSGMAFPQCNSLEGRGAKAGAIPERALFVMQIRQRIQHGSVRVNLSENQSSNEKFLVFLDIWSQIWGHVQWLHLVHALWEKNQVVKHMAGIEVHNLRLIGKVSDADQNTDIHRCRPIKWTRQERTCKNMNWVLCCRELCHSDILCQYWQCPTLVCDQWWLEQSSCL